MTSVIKPEGYVAVADPWEVIHDAYERGQTMEAYVTRVTWPDGVSPVWEVTFPALNGSGIRGLVPASESGLADKSLMQRFAGQIVRVKIKGIRKEDGMVACSRNEAVSEAQTAVFEHMKDGDVIDCVVRAVLPRTDERPPRLLLDVGGGVLVKVPQNRATYSMTLPLSVQFVPGQPVKAKVLRTAPQQGIIEVSVRDALPDPWEKADFRRGDFVAGTVRALRDIPDSKGRLRKHVFVEVPPGVLGIAPYPPRYGCRRGCNVNCIVKKFDRVEHLLRLELVGRRY